MKLHTERLGSGGGSRMVSCTDLLWDAPQPSRTAHCAANWIKLMLEKNLDKKFDLTQKLEQFPEKKLVPPNPDLILLRISQPRVISFGWEILNKILGINFLF